jgi:hypothetical protein
MAGSGKKAGGFPPASILLAFLDVDVAVVGLEKYLGSAAVNVTVNTLVDFHNEFSAAVPFFGFAGFYTGLDIKIGVDIPSLGFQFEAGSDIGRKGDIHVAVVGGKGHGLAGCD